MHRSNPPQTVRSLLRHVSRFERTSCTPAPPISRCWQALSSRRYAHRGKQCSCHTRKSSDDRHSYRSDRRTAVTTISLGMSLAIHILPLTETRRLVNRIPRLLDQAHLFSLKVKIIRKQRLVSRQHPLRICPSHRHPTFRLRQTFLILPWPHREIRGQATRPMYVYLFSAEYY